jgi:hypothetical protein
VAVQQIARHHEHRTLVERRGAGVQALVAEPGPFAGRGGIDQVAGDVEHHAEHRHAAVDQADADGEVARSQGAGGGRQTPAAHLRER